MPAVKPSSKRKSYANTSKPRSINKSDRFIPRRMTPEEIDVARLKLKHGTAWLSNIPAENKPYVDALLLTMYGETRKQFTERPILPIQRRVKPFQTDHSSVDLSRKKPFKSYELNCYRVLDLPDVSDDFYHNILSWGDNQLIAVALDDKLYGYHTETKDISLLGALDSTNSSQYQLVASIQSTNKLLAGFGDSNHNGHLQGYDTSTISLYTERILDRGKPLSHAQISPDVHMIGSKNGKLYFADLRDRSRVVYSWADTQTHSPLSSLSFNGANALAVGTSDSKVMLWDLRQQRHARLEYPKHRGAVKALAFSPFKPNVIASGGGSDDKKLRLWNSETGVDIAVSTIGKQLCTLFWRDASHLITTQGFSSNSVNVYKAKPKNGSFVLCAKAASHRDRVLFSAVNPNNKNDFATASSDEKLRFWKLKCTDTKRAHAPKPSRIHPQTIR